MNETLVQPIREHLEKEGISYAELKYGRYKEGDFQDLLGRAKAMIFLCEHETQGIAYQQALSCNVPILAWDRGGYWQDPNFYPDRVKFDGVSSVPYWSESCGLKFKEISEFYDVFGQFWPNVTAQHYAPRDYILDNLTLEKAATAYLKHVQAVQAA